MTDKGNLNRSLNNAPDIAQLENQNPRLGFSLKTATLARATLNEYSSGDPYTTEVCRHLREWSLKACSDYLGATTNLSASVGKTNAQAIVDGQFQNDRKSTARQADIKAAMDRVLALIEDIPPQERAAAALVAAAELIETAGYMIAREHDTKDVIPTFLLAQSLVDRAGQLTAASTA